MTTVDHRVLMVPDGLAGERVDAAMARLFGLSRTRAADLISEGHVSIDGAAVAKSDRLVPGTMLEVAIPSQADPLEVVPEIVEGIKIVHDDESIVVIDKPVGVAVHPSPGWTGPTVVGHLTAAGFRIATSGASERQGIVQRLDVGTSGVMVICKGERAYSVLKNAFRHRNVDKVYHALVQGHPDPLEGTIDAPIGRHPRADYKYAVMADGRHSVTHYETLEAHRFASLLEVHLETGRTHQIRVHMSALKHPCVGDLTYGADPTLAAAARARAAVAARRTPRLRAPRLRRVRRVRVDLPRRPRPRARGRPRCPLTPLSGSGCVGRAGGVRRARGALRPLARGRRRDAAGRAHRRGGPRAGSPPGSRDGEHEAWVAEDDGGLLGYALATATWLDHLFVDPSPAVRGRRRRAARRGQGRPARRASACGSSRPTCRARAFYARHGLVELERTDGSGNEEKAPDVQMAWPGRDPRRLLPRPDRRGRRRASPTCWPVGWR